MTLGGALLSVALAFAPVGLDEAFGASILDQLIAPPELELLGWNDGVMTGLLGDRRDRREELMSRSGRSLELAESNPSATDQIVLDAETPVGLYSVGYTDLIQDPIVEDSVPHGVDTDLSLVESLTDCSVWGDGSLPCESP